MVGVFEVHGVAAACRHREAEFKKRGRAAGRHVVELVTRMPTRWPLRAIDARVGVVLRHQEIAMRTAVAARTVPQQLQPFAIVDTGALAGAARQGLRYSYPAG